MSSKNVKILKEYDRRKIDEKVSPGFYRGKNNVVLEVIEACSLTRIESLSKCNYKVHGQHYRWELLYYEDNDFSIDGDTVYEELESCVDAIDDFCQRKELSTTAAQPLKCFSKNRFLQLFQRFWCWIIKERWWVVRTDTSGNWRKTPSILPTATVRIKNER